MRTVRRAGGNSGSQLLGLMTLLVPLTVLFFCPKGAAAGPENTRMVVVLYPENSDGSPGNALVDQSIRATLATGFPGRIEIHNEYLDVSRSPDADHQQLQIEFLRRKYSGRRVHLVIAGLSSALDFALKHRSQIFPGAPVVFCAVDHREIQARKLPADVIGVPVNMDLTATLALALRLQPNTRSVFVVAGNAEFDVLWEAEARRAFRLYEDKLRFVYLTGLPMEDLLQQVAHLPERSIIYYLHVFRDGTGKVLVPADVLERIASVANSPIYGHIDSYVGRGAVGGRVFSFATEGKNAAGLGLRVLAGETPENIGVQKTSANTYMFDWRQLRRWGISEASLPPASVVRDKELSFWDLYKWPIIGVISLCVVETVLIVGLLVQRSSRRRAEKRVRQVVDSLRDSQRELQVLTGRLLHSQEIERRRIARELHDDLNQSLALLSVDLDLLSQKPPESGNQLGERIQELSARVKELSSSVHNLSHQLHPSKLEQLGLVPAVRGLCKELTRSHGLPITFTHHEVPDTLPNDAALCLYRIVQEALGNVVKHSRAGHAKSN